MGAVNRQYFGIDIYDPAGCLVSCLDYVVGVVMMREILFRGKQRDNGNWIEGYLIHNEIENTHIPYIGYLFGDDDVDLAEAIPETVGQYTGLTDKNGKMIFEGDIIKNEYVEGKYQLFKIIYNETMYRWEVENKYRCCGKLCHVIGSMEIIGNIHDNPELLEEGDS